jgi:N-glycosylase/DNA lyase
MKIDMSSNDIRQLVREYHSKRDAIKKRLADFEAIGLRSHSRVFEELCFCICTPQSKAVLADKAIGELRRRKFLMEGSVECIRGCLSGVRFPNNKSKYIYDARAVDLKGILQLDDDRSVREKLVEAVKGMGMKEASHFLRNIGRARDLAILDVHILKNLKRLGVINDIPKTLTKKSYLEIEDRMKDFSRVIGVPLRELDLLFWSRETGVIFK